MDRELRQLLDEREIIGVVSDIGVSADRRDWQAVREAFAEEVLLDYSSMGAAVESLGPAEIVARWKALLPGFKMTQHANTNHRVSLSGDEAECFSYVNAMHHLPNDSGDDTWQVMGRYEHHLVRTARGWKVDRMKFIVTLTLGNDDLPNMATDAVKASNLGGGNEENL